MLPALKFGNINTLAGSFKALNGNDSVSVWASTAVSACISPSTMRLGSRWRNSSTALATRADSSPLTEPKFENDSIATRGTSPSVRTIRAAA